MLTTNRQPDIALAYEFLDGAGPVVVFCSGFGSDMRGTKAQHLWEFCASRGQAMLRFDYAGHGDSQGRFEEGCITDWTADAAHILKTAAAERDLLLVGSSMGGWIALLLARAFETLSLTHAVETRVHALLLIAPAPDFTELLIRPALSPAQQAELDANGAFHQPSPYGPPTPITGKLLEDGRKNLLLTGPIPITCPVILLHGMRDADVPWQQSLTLAERLTSEAVRLTFIKDGDHRLARASDLALLTRSLEELLSQNRP
jgi:pimeloyl-ACP methyl ester carboxylesterase